MYKIKLLFEDGYEEVQDEAFDTEESAIEYAEYLSGCSAVGAETLNLSNPGDYPYDEDEDYSTEYEIFEDNE